MSSTSLNYLDKQKLQLKNLKINTHKTYNYYELDKPTNKSSESLELVTSSNSLNINNKDFEKDDDSEIYQEIDIEHVWEETTPSTPTSLYDYINFEDFTPSDKTSSYYHYPVFKLKCLHLDDNSSISNKSYLSLYDGTYCKL